MPELSIYSDLAERAIALSLEAASMDEHYSAFFALLCAKGLAAKLQDDALLAEVGRVAVKLHNQNRALAYATGRPANTAPFDDELGCLAREVQSLRAPSAG